MAIVSQGILLYQKDSKAGNGALTWANITEDMKHATYGNAIPNLQEVGEIAGGVKAERDKIEITTLADDKHKFVNGIQAESEYDEITFKFLFEPAVYSALVGLQKAEQEWIANNPSVEQEETGSTWNVVIPAEDGAEVFKMFALISSIKMDGASVNGALTMTLALKPVKEIEFTASA